MTASIVYLPAPNVASVSTVTFVENLKKYPPKGQLIVYSDHADWKNHLACEFESMPIGPERLMGIDKNKGSGISNALFVVGMRIARKRKLSHVLYLEADCRVGVEGWDARIFDEHFSLPFPGIASGTMISWNHGNGGLDYIRRIQKMVSEHRDDPCPMMVYGSFPVFVDPRNPTLFPNGACSVLSVDWMWELFGGFTSIMGIVLGEGMEGKAWDYQIGERARKRFGNEATDLFFHLKSVASLYGDLAISKEQRLELLRNKSVAMAHQFKGTETV